MTPRFKPFGSFLLLLVLLILLAAPASSTPQSLDSVLTSVSGNVKEFRDSLPDFVCNERITSQNFDKNGKMTEQKVVESIFSARKRDVGQGPSFTEAREPLTINGKPAKKGAAFPEIPFSYGGGFSSTLFLAFHPDNLDSRTYKMAGNESVAGTNALTVEFATREGQQRLRFFLRGGDSYALKDSGKAWIHPGSMQALRVELHYLNTPNLNPFFSIIDYGEFSISGRQFWMPKMVKAERTDSKSKKKGVFTGEYSNCRRFGASVEIKTVTP